MALEALQMSVPPPHTLYSFPCPVSTQMVHHGFSQPELQAVLQPPSRVSPNMLTLPLRGGHDDGSGGRHRMGAAGGHPCSLRGLGCPSSPTPQSPAHSIHERSRSDGDGSGGRHRMGAAGGHPHPLTHIKCLSSLALPTPPYLVQLIAFIKGVAAMMTAVEGDIAWVLREAIHADVQEFARVYVASLLKRVSSSNMDSPYARTLLRIRAVAADWAGIPEEEALEVVVKSRKGHPVNEDDLKRLALPRPTPPSLAQQEVVFVSFMRLQESFQMHQWCTCLFDKAALPFKFSFPLSLLLLPSSPLQDALLQVTDLSFLWLRESKLLDKSFVAAATALGVGGRYSVAPCSYSGLLRQTHLQLLGRTVDMRDLLTQRLNKLTRRNLDFILGRMEGADLCHIMTAETPHGNLYAVVLYNVVCKRPLPPNSYSLPHSHQDLNEAYTHMCLLHSQFIGQPHVDAVVALLGPHSLPMLLQFCLDSLSHKVSHQLSPLAAKLLPLLPAQDLQIPFESGLPVHPNSAMAGPCPLPEPPQPSAAAAQNQPLRPALSPLLPLFPPRSLTPPPPFFPHQAHASTLQFIQAAPWLGLVPSPNHNRLLQLLRINPSDLPPHEAFTPRGLRHRSPRHRPSHESRRERRPELESTRESAATAATTGGDDYNDDDCRRGDFAMGGGADGQRMDQGRDGFSVAQGGEGEIEDGHMGSPPEISLPPAAAAAAAAAGPGGPDAASSEPDGSLLELHNRPHGSRRSDAHDKPWHDPPQPPPPPPPAPPAAPLTDLLQRVCASVPVVRSSMLGMLQAAQVAGETR
ncbi:unnamed protein product [Closterium sp. Yama58-4]|nr:unnamed protein product [Closterium sp. Yama58-4]